MLRERYFRYSFPDSKDELIAQWAKDPAEVRSLDGRIPWIVLTLLGSAT